MSWFERDWGISADSNVVLFKKTHTYTHKKSSTNWQTPTGALYPQR